MASKKKKKKGGMFGAIRGYVGRVAKAVGIGMKTTRSRLNLFNEVARVIRETPEYTQPARRRRGAIENNTGPISPQDFLLQLTGLRQRAEVTQATDLNRSEKFEWTKADLNNIKSRVQERIFKVGLNSADQQMRPPRRRLTEDGRSRNQPFRYDTGELYRSIRLDVNGKKGNLELKFTREKNIIENLIKIYGQIFEFSESDIQYIVFLYLRNTNRIPKGIRAPQIRSTGAAPHNV